MTESSQKKISCSRREEWLSHMNACEQSHLNHAEYCRGVGISYSSFKYWRGILLNEKIFKEKDKFVAIKIEKPKASHSESSPRSIQVKLVSGNVVYIPATLPMVDIGQLIRSLENGHA